MVDENKLNSVLEITYLGSTISSNRCNDDKIQRRMAKASASFGRLRQIVGRICNNFRLSCALPERSMKLSPMGFLRMLISKIAGTTTSLQRFPPKMKKFKMAATKHVFAHKMALSSPITMIFMSIPMFLGSRNPIKHI